MLLSVSFTVLSKVWSPSRFISSSPVICRKGYSLDVNICFGLVGFSFVFALRRRGGLFHCLIEGFFFVGFFNCCFLEFRKLNCEQSWGDHSEIIL